MEIGVSLVEGLAQRGDIAFDRPHLSGEGLDAGGIAVERRLGGVVGGLELRERGLHGAEHLLTLRRGLLVGRLPGLELRDGVLELQLAPLERVLALGDLAVGVIDQLLALGQLRLCLIDLLPCLGVELVVARLRARLAQGLDRLLKLVRLRAVAVGEGGEPPQGRGADEGAGMHVEERRRVERRIAHEGESADGVAR